MSTSNASTRLPAPAHKTAPSRVATASSLQRPGAGRGQRNRPVARSHMTVPCVPLPISDRPSGDVARTTSDVSAGPAKRSSSTPVRGSTMRTAPCSATDDRQRGRPEGTEPRPCTRGSAHQAARRVAVRSPRTTGRRPSAPRRARRRRRSRRRACRRDLMLRPRTGSRALGGETWPARRQVPDRDDVRLVGPIGREHDVPTVRGEVDARIAHAPLVCPAIRRFSAPVDRSNSWIPA